MISPITVKFGTVITYYFGEKYIAELLLSLKRAITYAKSNRFVFSHKTVIVNDCSSENSHLELIDAVDKSRLSEVSEISLINNEINVGVTLSRRKGIKYARECDYLNIVDQDDMISENLMMQILSLNQKKELRTIYLFGASIVNESSERVGKNILQGNHKSCEKISKKCSNISSLIYGGNPIKTPGMLVFLKDGIEIIDSFYDLVNEKIDGSDDYIAYLFLLKKGFRFHHTGNIGLYYRIHNNNQSKTIGTDFIERAATGVKILEQNGVLTKVETSAILKRYTILRKLQNERFRRFIVIFSNPLTSFKIWLNRI